MTEMERWELRGSDDWVPMVGPVRDLAEGVARTQFVPRAFQGNVAAVAAAVLTGRELGLGPMTSLRGIDVIEGKPALTAQMLAARIFAAGHRIQWTQSTDRACTVRIERADRLSEAEVTWTMADAQRAGLAHKKVWQQYPRHMLRHRALTECAGMVCPDVSLGLDTADDSTDRPPDALERDGSTGASVVRIEQGLPEQVGKSGTVLPEPEPGPSPSQVLVEESAASEPMATRAQLTKINAQLGELDRIEGRKLGRDERRDFIRTLLGLDGLASAKDLTRDEASRAIEEMDRVIAAAAPVRTDAETEVQDAVIVEEDSDA